METMGEDKDKSKHRTGRAKRHSGRQQTLRDAQPNPVPGWRQIEALRERQALKDELSDIWSDDPDLDENIFFSESDEASNFYQPAARLRDLDFKVDEDADSEDDG